MQKTRSLNVFLRMRCRHDWRQEDRWQDCDQGGERERAEVRVSDILHSNQKDCQDSVV